MSLKNLLDLIDFYDNFYLKIFVELKENCDFRN